MGKKTFEKGGYFIELYHLNTTIWKKNFNLPFNSYRSGGSVWLHRDKKKRTLM